MRTIADTERATERVDFKQYQIDYTPCKQNLTFGEYEGALAGVLGGVWTCLDRFLQLIFQALVDACLYPAIEACGSLGNL